MFHFFSRLFGFHSRAAKAQAEALAAENAAPAVCICEPEDVHCDAMLDLASFDDEWEDDELYELAMDDDFFEDDWNDAEPVYADCGSYGGYEEAYAPAYAYGGGAGGFCDAD